MTPGLGAILERNAAENGTDPFLVTAESTISYAESADLVGRLRGVLAQHGVAPGSRVLLIAPNGPAFVFAWLAVAGLDATIVPVHDQLLEDGVSRVVSDASATHAVGTVDLLCERGGGLHAIDAAHRIEVDDRLSGLVGAEPAGVCDEVAHPCSILYTSGTTGPPKGVVLSHRSYLAAAAAMAAGLGIGSRDRILTALPLYHANPQFYAVATALTARASVAVLPRFSPRTFLADAVRLGATGFTYVGTILAMLAKHAQPTSDHALRFCVGGGAPAAVWSELESKWGVRIHELYGSTETGSFVTLNTRSSYRRNTCGRAREDMEVAILGPGDERLAAGAHGEIAVRPLRPSVVFDGYHGRPDLTLARSRNLWFHTGDWGWLDDAGFLCFGGRLDHRLRRGGENIDPQSVEEVLHLHPAVREAAVVGVPDEVMGEEIKAVIVGDGSFDPWSLPGFLDGRLPRLAWPRYVELRTALPMTPTEKLAVDRLRASEAPTIDLKAGA